MALDAEVIVVGGGLAGCATALAFARAGHDVLVLDRVAFPRGKVCGEGLFPHGADALARLGIAPPVGARPFRGIRFSSGEISATGRFPGGRRGLGLRRIELDAALVDAARAEPRIRVAERTAVRGLGRDGDTFFVRTSYGALRGRLIVGADGLHSPVRGWAGLERERRGRRRYGVRAHFALPVGAPDPEWVEVHRVGGGELYVTPVARGEVNVAALCEHATIRRFKGDLAGGLRRMISACPPVDALLAGADPVDTPAACGPLRQEARTPVADGVLLVGDAAGFLDGITGEGMSIALHGAEIAGEVGAAALARGDVRADALRAYAVRRARLVREVERLGKLVLWGIRSRTLTEGVLRGLARRPDLFDHLLAVETGETTLGSIGLRGALGWVRA